MAKTKAKPQGADWLNEIYKTIGQSDANQDVKYWLSTGYLELNKAISGRHDGGVPGGRITEIFGGESSGKTLLATMIMIETQKKDGLAVFLDYEHAFSIGRARQLGLVDDPQKWIYKQPETAERGFAVIEHITNIVRKHNTTKYVTIIIDSVAAMLTQEESETDFGDENMRTKASLASCMSVSLKPIAKIINKGNVTLVFLNQTRSKIGVIFGSNEKTAGGNALKFYASVRARISKAGLIKDGDETIGENAKVQIVKNKVYEPYKNAEYITHFTEGVNLHASHLAYAKKLGVVELNGAWYSYKGERLGQGISKVEQFLKSNDDIYQDILKGIMDVK